MAEAPEALIQQAQNSLAVGDTAAALASLNQLLQHYPRHPQGLFRRGFVRIRGGDVDGAIEDWEQAAEVDAGVLRQLDGPAFRQTVEASLQHIKLSITKEPTNIHFQVQLGKAYSAFGRYAQALQAYTSALRLAPELIEAGLGSAEVYLRLGQGEQALQVLQKLYELHSDNADLCWRLGKVYNNLNSVIQATRFFERASTLDPNDWRSNLELGQIFMRQGRHEQATARFQKTLQLKPGSAAALVGLAECCKELYRFEAAISYYQQAVAVDPTDYKALCQMGSLCIQLGGLDVGIETLQRALDLNANDVEIHSSLAKAYQQKGDLPTAARYFAKTVEFNPKDYFAAYNLGLIYRSQGQIKEAADAFGTAAQLRPNDSQYQYQSSRALLELGQVEEALEAARKAVALNPHSKESQLLYGRCCLEGERYESGAEAFRAAVRIDAQNVEAHYQLAVALLNLGQTEEARSSFHTVLRLSPQHAPSQLGLGHVARRTGQWQTAADHYRQAIQLDLTLKPAIQELTKLYLERNQKESINEFVRQICLSRRGDHRIPADFLLDWLEALESNQQHALAEEALEFVLSLYPTSPQGKENHRTFHLRSAAYFLEKGQNETVKVHLEQLRKMHPQDPAVQELQQAISVGSSSSTGSAKSFDSLDDPLWAPLDMEPKPKVANKSLLTPPLPAKKPLSSLLPPPPIDDFAGDAVFFSEPVTLSAGMTGLAPLVGVTGEGLGPSLSEPPPLSTLLPPPLDDFVHADLELSNPWESKQVSRLALEDISAALNPEETLVHLAQHYVDFALHLESCGWLKQASLFLTDARNFRPSDPSLVEHQMRVLAAWADRLDQSNDPDGASQLRSWLPPAPSTPLPPPPLPRPEPVSAPMPEIEVEEPPVLQAITAEPETLALDDVSLATPVGPGSEPTSEVDSVDSPADLDWPEIAQPPHTPPAATAHSAPLAARPLAAPTPLAADPPLTTPPASALAAPTPLAADPPPTTPPASALAPSPDPPQPASAPVTVPFTEPEVTPEPEPEPEASQVETKSSESKNDIAEWMKSLGEPPSPPPPPPTPETEPEPEPVLAAPDEAAASFKSAEMEFSLTGQESAAELVQLIARYPDDERIRQALLQAFSNDVPGLLKVFRELSLEAPEEPYHVLNLARAYAHTGSDSLAVLQYRKYVKIEPSSEGYRELGQIYGRMGKSELASQALRRSEQLAAQEEDE